MSRTIRITPDVARWIERERSDGEAVTDTLRRALGLAPRVLRPPRPRGRLGGRRRVNDAGGRIRNRHIDREEIRRLYTAGRLTQTELAERFGISQAYVSRIVRGRVA